MAKEAGDGWEEVITGTYLINRHEPWRFLALPDLYEPVEMIYDHSGDCAEGLFVSFEPSPREFLHLEAELIRSLSYD